MQPLTCKLVSDTSIVPMKRGKVPAIVSVSLFEYEKLKEQRQIALLMISIMLV